MKHLILMMAALGMAVGCSDQSDGRVASDDRAERALPVVALEVRPRDLSRTLVLSAPVEPLRTIRLAAQTDGILTEVLAEEGDAVAAGEELARIDVREQRAELARAHARLQERQASYERIERLLDRDYVDAATYENARAELEIARTDVELWQTRVDFGTVVSTIDGVVVERYIEPGEAIARHAALFSIADLERLVVRLGVSELDVGQLTVGQIVSLQLDALSRDEPVDGRIRRIFPAAEMTSRLITVEVEIPQGRNRGIRPGFLARAELLVESLTDAIAVPAGSVAESDGEHFVMVINAEERLERRVIEAGAIRGTWREVRSGLSASERVIAANPLEMSAGDRVRVVDLLDQENGRG